MSQYVLIGRRNFAIEDSTGFPRLWKKRDLVEFLSGEMRKGKDIGVYRVHEYADGDIFDLEPKLIVDGWSWLMVNQ